MQCNIVAIFGYIPQKNRFGSEQALKMTLMPLLFKNNTPLPILFEPPICMVNNSPQSIKILFKGAKSA